MTTIIIKMLIETPDTIESVTQHLDSSKIISIQSDEHTTVSATEYAKHKAEENHKKLDKWVELFKPILTPYSNRSVLAKSSIENSLCMEDWYIIPLPLGKQLYYNKTLQGWITSIDNKSYLNSLLVFKTDIENTSFDDTLSDWSGDGEANTVLGNYTYSYYKKGILMVTKDKDTILDLPYFHNGYWNKTLKGWVFSKKYEDSLKEKGAVLVAN
jgi:hypothetical protein